MFRRLKELVTYIRVEAFGGVLLLLAAAAAVVCNNSPFAPLYDTFIHAHSVIPLGWYALNISTHAAVNDLLMTIFFLVVGLEIKREVLAGELADRSTALLPVIGAIGGMVIPALIYIAFNFGGGPALNGWAIPTATDIAFSLAVISLFGRTLPFSLKVFLTALAIIDDLLAILVIAFFYTASLSVVNLLFASGAFLVLVLINRMGCRNLFFYLIPGSVLFYFIHHSGIHATIAGVLTALTVPLHSGGEEKKSPLRTLEHVLHPWVAYLILPLFAFVNAGVDLQGLSIEMLAAPVTLGCLFGLFLGKQAGVFFSILAASKCGIVSRPVGATWAHVYGVSILTGIGFTMSLFIGGLAFTTPEVTETVKLGVLIGSLLSAVAGAGVLFFCRKTLPN